MGMLTAVACLVFFNSTFLYSKVVRSLGLVRTANLGLLLVTAGLACLGASTNAFMVPVSVLFYAFGVPYFTPSIPTLLAQSSPSSRRGLVLGVDSAVSTIARIISPVVMGLLYHRWGPASTFRCASIFPLAGAGLMVFQHARL